MNSRTTIQERQQLQTSMPLTSGILQRKCACGNHTFAGGNCDSCNKKQNEMLHRKTADFGEMNEAPAIVHDVLRSQGQPLDNATRTFFEPKFGSYNRQSSAIGGSITQPASNLVIASEHDPLERKADQMAEQITHTSSLQASSLHGYDFSQVRIHNDAKAAESASAINALAYTVGNHVVFGRGQYAPQTMAGRKLLAHELAHITQGEQDSGSQAHRKIWRKTFWTNESACTATIKYRVQLLFKEHEGNAWDATRKYDFRSQFKNTIENSFNSNSFRIKPSVNEYESGWISTEKKSCPCAADGFIPKLQIALVKDGETSTSEDWEIDVHANPSGKDIRSETNTSYGTLDEADTTAIAKASSGPGVTQIPAVHEFGHFLGLDHPGEGLEGGWFSDSKLSPGANEYGHKGKDKEGRDVDGTVDLMGAGMGLRAFYFDTWKDELADKYGSECGWSTK